MSHNLAQYISWDIYDISSQLGAFGKKTALEKEPKMVAERVLFASFLSSQHKAFVLRDHKPKSGHVYL